MNTKPYMPQTLPNGTLLSGRFQIKRLLSESPLGAVYLVDDVKITEKPWVAREYLPLPASLDERIAAEQSFHDVVERIIPLSHPNLVKVIDSFLEGDRTYLITEHVDGMSLDAIAAMTGNPLPENQVLEWAVQVCDPLAYLHSLPSPVYMKDLHPRYVLANRDGQIKLGGYGLDLIFSKKQNQSFPCMAPEIESDGKGSAAGDIYSLGACLYTLLAKQTPKQPPEPIKSLNGAISDGTARLVMSCLAEEPSLRPPDAMELQNRLYNILNPPKETPPPPPKVTFGDIYRRGVARAMGALASIIELGVQIYDKPYYLVLLALVAGALIYTFNPFSRPPYHKIGPVVYALCGNRVMAVDPKTLKAVDRIPGLSAQFAAMSPSGIWFGSAQGDLFLVDPDNDSVTKQLSAGQPIGGLAAGPGGLLYVSLVRDNTLDALGPNGQPLSVTPVGRIPGDVLYSPEKRRIFVAASGENAITVVDAQKHSVYTTVHLTGSPSHIALSADGAYLFVVYNNAARMDVYNTNDYTLVNTFDLGSDGPYAVAGSSSWAAVAADNGSHIYFYQIANLLEKGNVSLDRPETAAFSADGTGLFAGTDSGYVYLVDPSSGQTLQHGYVGKNLEWLLFAK